MYFWCACLHLRDFPLIFPYRLFCAWLEVYSGEISVPYTRELEFPATSRWRGEWNNLQTDPPKHNSWKLYTVVGMFIFYLSPCCDNLNFLRKGADRLFKQPVTAKCHLHKQQQIPSCYWTLFSFAETRETFSVSLTKGCLESWATLPCKIRETSSAEARLKNSKSINLIYA